MKSAVLLAFVLGAGVLFAAPDDKPQVTADTLDAYAKQELDVSANFIESRPLLTADQLDEVAAELERVGPGWSDHHGALAAPKRRLIAATFALEMARSIVMRPLRPPDPQAHMPLVSQRFLAWGCARLRDDPHPQEAERLWDFAAIGIAGAPGRGGGQRTAAFADSLGLDWDVYLLGESWPQPQHAVTAMTNGASGRSARDSKSELAQELAEGHLAHALTRFPDVPEFQFARARAIMEANRDAGIVGVPIEEQTGPLDRIITDEYLARLSSADAAAGPAERRVVSSTGTDHDREFAIGTQPPADEVLRLGELRHARATFEQLAVPGPLEAYAHLYAGIIALKFADASGALQHFDTLERLARDPGLHYDARALSGVAHERQQEWDQAITSYRSALAVMPHGRFAGTRLTILLLRLGRSADAETFEDAFLSDPALVNTTTDTYTQVVRYQATVNADPLLALETRVNSLFSDAFDQLKKAIQ